jgi:prepilin-type N-terminal cleavage/methylation domain-containing protein
MNRLLALKARRSSGFSLVEVAVTMVIISISLLIVVNMGGAKMNLTQGNQNDPNAFYSGPTGLTQHKSREYLFATSQVENVLAGNFTPITNVFGRLPRPGETLTSGVVTDNSASKPFFYQWSITRVAGSGTNASTFNAINNQNLPDTAIPNGNEYYRAAITMLRNNAAPNPQNIVMTMPFSVFRNVGVPPEVQSHTQATVAMDSSSSMMVAENGLPRIFYAKETLFEFANLLQTDAYVSDRTALGLLTFNENTFRESFLRTPVFPNNRRTYDLFNARVACIMPEVNQCVNQVPITAQGRTNLINPMVAAFNDIRTYNNQFSDWAPDGKRSFDRVMIFVTDGEHTVSDANQALQTLNTLTIQNGRNAARNDRITLFTVGLLAEPAQEVELRRMVRNTPSGLYIPARSITELDDAFEMIENQFQFFALKRKPERWQVFL